MTDIALLNVEEGISRVVNNRALYGKLLLRLADTMVTAPQDIAALLAGNSREEAQRLAHSLKGSAANLSATAVASVAQKVEHAITEGQPVDAALQELQSVVDATLVEIKAFSV